MDEMYNEDDLVRTGEHPAGGTGQTRTPAPEFLAPGARSGNREAKGYRNLPGRPLEQDIVVDGQVFTEPPSPELLERIRSATSMADEPECIGRAIVDAYGSDARFYRDQQHAAWVLVAREARAELSLEARIDDVERRARRRKLNFVKGIADARETLSRTRRGGRKPPESLMRLVRSLEARLDGPLATEREAA